MLGRSVQRGQPQHGTNIDGDPKNLSINSKLRFRVSDCAGSEDGLGNEASRIVGSDG
jgi:hypothetical protein